MRNTPSSRSNGRRAALIRVVGALLLSIFAGCARDKTADPKDLLRDIPPELARHLIESDDSTLVRYGRSVGFVVLSDASERLGGRTKELYAKGRDDEASVLSGFHKRIALVLSSEFHYPLYIAQLEFMENLPGEARRKLMETEKEFYAYRADVRRPARERIETYAKFLETFRTYDDVLYVALTEYELAWAWKSVGDEPRHVEFLRAACSHFAQCGLHEMTSVALGELGECFERTGEIDSMVCYFEKARRIAERSRLPWETASVDGWYADYYARQGRLSLAHELLARAIEVCRQYRGEYSELSHIVEATQFEARLGCWGVVDRMIARARVLESRCGDDPQQYRELFSLQLDVVEGRSKMAKGDVGSAEALFRRAEKTIGGLRMPYTREPEAARLYAFWSAGLLDNGRPSNAIEIARRGARAARGADAAEAGAQCLLLMAKAALQKNDLGSCRKALEEFDSFRAAEGGGLERERVQKFALLGRLELSAGNRAAAEKALGEGLRTLREFAARSDASVQSYLWIGECDELRQLLHDVTAADPIRGYGAELLWHDFYRLVGGERRGHTADSAGDRTTAGRRGTPANDRVPALADVENRARALRKRIGELDAVHSVYVIRGERILRWTASSAGVRCDTIAAPTREIAARCRRVWETVERRGLDAMPPSGSQENLRALARLMLPREVLRDTIPAREAPFFVTADGFLNLVPFESFDAANDGPYSPLLLRRDVAYLRYAEYRWSAPDTGRGVVVVDPRASDELRARYLLPGELKEASKEAAAVAALAPESHVLNGSSATKSNLKSLWLDAPFLYFAAHTLRDPEIPYLMLIPLAAPDEPSAPDASYLDFTDIRQSDFRRSPVVVLSGCSSGALYVDVRNFGPSLGVGFLDAGASAVVETFWDVEDRQAAELMTRFLPLWRSPNTSAVHALSEARRSVYWNTRGLADLPAWGSFYIELARP